MVATSSTMLPLGCVAPDFILPDTQSGQLLSLEQLKGKKATLIMFICNHCPYVIHVRPQLIAIAQQYRDFGVSLVAISSNDVVNYPQDSPEKMQQLMLDWGQPFAAYLYDETQAVARRYQAACTPDFFLFNADLELVYRGRLDASTPKNSEELNGKDLKAAMDAVITGREVNPEQIPSLGCNIKWKINDE